ncbi:hypothetical protein [Micromonospora zhanjiangensis]|uniref:Uncharacterized protein n=1 Tax=Micromonospora zhanjiangensis TaxID=1522057 RepID=A0ABV8KM50_9ACTN
MKFLVPVVPIAVELLRGRRRRRAAGPDPSPTVEPARPMPAE